ncbi:MAG: MATE family efflux transporter [Pirellulaceae bacterium]|nr:MATE family efflux transporter [Pirellulaceae bacterium]
MSQVKQSFLSWWWNAECGLRDVLKIALPLMISTSLWSIMQFTDRLFLMWHPASEMSAAVVAGALHFSAICIPWGLASYINTFVAQYHSTQQVDRMGRYLWQGVWVGVLTFPAIWLLIFFSDDLFRFAGHSDTIRKFEVSYLSALGYGSGAMVISMAMSTYFMGRGQTATVMVVDLICVVVNIIVDYGLIFGKGGLPELGIYGAGLATAMTVWIKTTILATLLIWANKQERELQLFRYIFPCWKTMKRLFYYGLPSALQFFIEVTSYTFLLMMIGSIGDQAHKASGLALSVNDIAFVPVFGLSIALTTITGHQLGIKRPDLATRATWTTLTLGLGYTAIFSILYAGFPDLLLAAHYATNDPNHLPATKETTIILLRFVAFYCIFDTINLIFSGTIKGAGDTQFLLFCSTAISLIFMTIVAIGLHYGFGLYFVWLIMSSWIFTLGVAFFLRFLRGKWRTMHVIEPELL